jgi:hypothetical protein
MGDEAENMFEIVSQETNFGIHRSGLNRPNFNMSRLPVMIRYTPDYLTEDSYVEVQGFGKDQLVKIKKEKLDALHAWDQHFATEMFLWDSVNRRWAFIAIPWFTHHEPQIFGIYPEGKEWVAWEADTLPVMWTYRGAE